MSRLFARYRRVLNANQTIKKRHILTNTKNETKRNATKRSEVKRRQKNRTYEQTKFFLLHRFCLFSFISFVCHFRSVDYGLYAAYCSFCCFFAFKGDGCLSCLRSVGCILSDSLNFHSFTFNGQHIPYSGQSLTEKN